MANARNIQSLLSPLFGNFRAAIRYYQGNQVLRTLDFAVPLGLSPVGSSELATDTGLWECAWTMTSVSDQADGVEVKLCFRLKSGHAVSAGVAAIFDFQQWATANYVLLPGAVYRGNRFRCLPRVKYPPLFRDPADWQPDLPTTITDIPHLEQGSGRSRIEQTTGDPSTPAMGFFSPACSHGFWLFTEQQTRFGNSGLTVGETDERDQASFMVTAPCVREFRTVMCSQIPSQDQAVDWQAGDSVTLRLRLHVFPVATVQGFFDRFCQLRKTLAPAAEQQHQLPFSAAWNLLEAKYNLENWDDEHGFFCSGTRTDLDGNPVTSMNNQWQLGWCGGGMVTQALIADGTAQSRERAQRNLDTMLVKTVAPSGFLYGMGDGKNWFGDGFYDVHPGHMHMVRKSADALYFLGKQFKLLAQQDSAWKPSDVWLSGYRGLAEAFVRLWNRYGQFGQFVNVETGDLMVGATTSGGIVPAGLALAAEILGWPRALDVAEAAAGLYYDRDVCSGVTNAGPGEILQAPDSESAFALLESFVVLYEATAKAKWLRAAGQLARQCASWVVSYDYRFPVDSLFGKLDMRSNGAVYANAQNKHAAPGICTLSGDSLLKLFRATGEHFYLELLTDIAHHLPQYVSRVDRPIGRLRSGWINERVNLSDWEVPYIPVGGIFEGSCWPEVSLMLTWIEVPGLYVQPDCGLVQVLDHVSLEATHREEDGSLTVTLRNSTSFPARLRVLAETTEQARVPLGVNAALRWPLVEIPAGQDKTLRFSPFGNLKNA